MSPPNGGTGEGLTINEVYRAVLATQKQVENLDGKVTSLDRDMRDRIDKQDRVSFREWERAREHDRLYNEETRTIATTARNINWAMFALVATSILMAAFALLQSV